MRQKSSEKIFAFISKNEGSNCFLLLGKKETALIDSSAEGNRQEIIEWLSSLRIKPADVTLVLHTHGHADHFGLDNIFPKAKIAMHEADAEKVNAGNREFACMQFFPNSKMPQISLFLKADQEIDLGGISLKVIHTPGHTEGSVCFFLAKEKAVFSGDTLFANGFGRTDFASSNAQKMLFSLKKLQKMPLQTLFPGHGPFLLGSEQITPCLKTSLKSALTNSFL